MVIRIGEASVIAMRSPKSQLEGLSKSGEIPSCGLRRPGDRIISQYS